MDLNRSEVCQVLRHYERYLIAVMKQRISIHQKTCALIAAELQRAKTDPSIVGEDEFKRGEHVKLMAGRWNRDERDKPDLGDPVECDVAIGMKHLIDDSAGAEKVWQEREKAIRKQIGKAAKQLPAWSWCEKQRGLGEIALGRVIGEAGDLHNYGSPAKLWKRFGLHVIKGKAPSTWRRSGGLSKAEWEVEGYSPSRQSIIFSCVITPLVNQGEEYRDLYLYRKELEQAKIANGELVTRKHADMRAKRYLGKRVLRDLWNNWQ